MMDNVLFYVFPIAIGLLLGALISKKFGPKAHKKHENLVVMEWPEFKRNMRKGQLIDIRKDEAFKKDKIKGARNFPLRILKNKNQTKVRKDLPLYLYCDNGKKSYKVGNTLLRKGFQKVYILKGGFPATKMTFEEESK